MARQRDKIPFAIETKALTRKFGDFVAVNRLNLKIEKGTIYGLLGPNGAGKTTIIKMLCGLLKPTGGEVYVLGKKIPNKSITPSIGYMPQETGLYLGLTVHQNLELFGEIFGLGKKRIAERETELLEFIGLEKWRDALVANLSGGMKHRVSLACSMIHNPELLILDEPTVGIDPELRVSFWNYFYKLKERVFAILITTHYMDEAQHCDKIGLMSDGRLIAEGTPKELLKISGTKSLEEAFLKFSAKERGIKK